MKRPPPHILIVDDDLELAIMYQALLEVHGYQASTAANGREALKLVLRTKVDAILCDLNMPELSGDLFYREVGLARPKLLKRFVFVTANGDNPLYETFLKRTRALVLAKPVGIGLLLETLKTIVRGCEVSRKSSFPSPPDYEWIPVEGRAELSNLHSSGLSSYEPAFHQHFDRHRRPVLVADPV